MTRSILSLAAVLVLFSAGSVIAEPVEQSEDTVEPERQIVVYYFHGDKRCKTCLAIEANAEAAVSSRFAEQLKSGELAWRTVNYDEPENEHFIKDFGLVSSSLVLVEMIGGKPAGHEVLQKAWTLARDKPGFEHYVQQSVLQYLGSSE
jgi:hypothetical protein